MAEPITTASIVASAISEATGGSDLGDTGDNSADVDQNVTGDQGDEQVDTGDADESAGAAEQDDAEGDADPDAQADADAGAEGSEGEEGEKEGDEFAKEHGLKEPKQGERENRIPYTQVKRIVANAEKKIAESLLGGKVPDGKTAKQVVQEHVASVTELRTNHEKVTGELENVNVVGHMMVNDPAQFQQVLLQLNPAWADYLKMPGQKDAQEQHVAGADMPAPDYDMGNGQATYSPKGLQALLDWHAGKVTEKVLQQVGKEVKPFKDERERQQYFQQVIIPRLTQRVNHARTSWPGFKDNEAEILAAVQANPKLGLDDAYITVREKKRDEELSAAKKTQSQLKKKIVTDLKTAPNATSAGAGRTIKPGVSNEPKTTADIVRESIRGL